MNPQSTNPLSGSRITAAESAECQAGGAALLRFSRRSRSPELTEEPIDDESALGTSEFHHPERLANRLQLLLKALPGGVLVLDANGRVEECNPAANHILGHPLLGGLWRDVAASIFCPQVDDELDLTLHNRRRVNITTCSLGQEPGQILLIQDVTEKREMQAKLDGVKRLCELGEMMAALAHQIRTPLASALLHATNLQSFPHETKRLAPQLVERLRSLDELVNGMLSFASQGSLAVTRITLPSLLKNFSSCLEDDGGLVHSTFEMGRFSARLRIMGNPEALSSVFQNLVNNARQAVGGARLTLNTVAELDGDVLVVKLSDDGPGIPAELAERVFDPFVTTRADGVGLGLAIARRIVESHGGTLNLDRATSPGASFVIRLPISEGMRDEPGSLSAVGVQA